LGFVEPATTAIAAPAAIGGTPDSGPFVVPVRRRLGRAFWRLWGATAISATGDGLVFVALPLLTLTITRSPLAIAGVTVAYRALAAIAALPAGVVADRLARRSVMVLSNVIAGTTMVSLVAALSVGHADLAMLYIAAAVLAVCDATYTLAMQASFPDVVPTEQLAAANGRLMAVEGAGESFLGPGVGGVLFALAQRLPFLADGLSFFVSALLVRTSLPQRSAHGLHCGHDPAGARGSEPGTVERHLDGRRYQGRHQLQADWSDDFRQGLRLFRREPSLKLLAATAASGTFAQGMVFAILVLYGRFTLHLTATGYGVFLALASLLGLVGAFSAATLQRRFGWSRLIIGGSALVGVSYLGLTFTRSAVLAVFVFGLQEFGAAVSTVGSVTARQNIIQRKLYGRIASIHRLIITGAAPLGALVAGVIASASSVRLAVFTAGALETTMVALLAPALVRALAGAPRVLGPQPA